MPHYPSLKVVGWTSSYKSVQKYLNWVRKEKLDDQAATVGLQCIDLLCQHMDMNPDEIVALGKKKRLTLSSFDAALQQLGLDKEVINMALADVIIFLSESRAW